MRKTHKRKGKKRVWVKGHYMHVKRTRKTRVKPKHRTGWLSRSM